MPTLTESAQLIQDFEKESLSDQISAIETILQGADASKIAAFFQLLGIDPVLLEAALIMKNAAGQINVIIHAVGILLTIPNILSQEEQVISLSLGAGSTGKPFDLETTQRIAEFKFIHWRGGSEAIRQNSLFKDFYLLAKYKTEKTKELYVIGTEHPLKFLRVGRSLSSVMSRNNRLWQEFQEKFGSRFSRVRDYYQYRKEEVRIKDLTEFMPSLGNKGLTI